MTDGMEIVPWALAALLAGIIIGACGIWALAPAFLRPQELRVQRDESGRIVDVQGL